MDVSLLVIYGFCSYIVRRRLRMVLLVCLCVGPWILLMLTLMEKTETMVIVSWRKPALLTSTRTSPTTTRTSPTTTTSQWPIIFKCPLSPGHNHKGLNSLLDTGDPISPHWMRTQKQNSSFFLVEAIQVRIYETDKAKWTIRELKQWIHYMLWAGVEHIYLCDHFKSDQERLYRPLKKYIDLDLVTYIPWNVTGTAMMTQVSCYLHVKNKYQHLTKWMISVDMDEYPFVTDDFKEGFLSRYLARVKPEFKVVLLHNLLMLGVGDRTRDMVSERINRITRERANKLDKPIFQPNFTRPGIHTANIVGAGKKINGDERKIHLVHYWGGRLQKWGPDTDYIRNMTVEFNDLRDFVSPFVRMSLLIFGECDAFNSSSGP